jgi:hypothetical protein
MAFDDDNGEPASPPAVTADSLNAYLKSKESPLEGEGPNFMKWGLQYNIDPRLMVAIAGAESTFGKNLQAGNFNPFGLLYNSADPYHSDYESWDHAIKGLGYSLSNKKNGYDLSNTENMYKTYCTSGDCRNGVANINRFMQEQGADPNALYFLWPPSQSR